MATITAEQAENEAARNWCAGLLAGAGSRIEGDVAKRWVDIGVGILLSIYKDGDTVTEMTYDEKMEACHGAPYAPGTTQCIVRGVVRSGPQGGCEGCPYDRVVRG